MVLLKSYSRLTRKSLSGLVGDGTEKVDLHLDSNLAGEYLFLRRDGKDVYLKQSNHWLGSIDRIVCKPNFVISSSQRGFDYNPVSDSDPEYASLKKRLEESGCWRPMRRVVRYEFKSSS